MPALDKKFEMLKEILKEMGAVIVAFSGGVDSTFLLKAALDTLGSKKVIAVTARSATYPQRELEEAGKMAEVLRVRHTVIDSEELDIPGFKDNPPDRCYHCKKELFGKLRRIAEKEEIKYVLDGSNHDDQKDYRPGMKAAAELGIRSPLMEAALTKSDIRALSKKLGLNTWDKGAFACLSSRFPYGQKITREKLCMVDRAENCLRDFGFREVRARHYEETVRMELGQNDMEKLFKNKDLTKKIVKELKEIGYLYITLDLEGYQMGSMNRVLDLEKQDT